MILLSQYICNIKKLNLSFERTELYLLFLPCWQE